MAKEGIFKSATVWLGSNALGEVVGSAGSRVRVRESLRQEPFGSDRMPWVKLSVLLAAVYVYVYVYVRVRRRLDTALVLTINDAS